MNISNLLLKKLDKTQRVYVQLNFRSILRGFSAIAVLALMERVILIVLYTQHLSHTALQEWLSKQVQIFIDGLQERGLRSETMIGMVFRLHNLAHPKIMLCPQSDIMAPFGSPALPGRRAILR
ncbi:hypothetical protein C1N60_23385 (plasmid) [Pantoea sp. SGAir0184]